jgi:hypothetical protein
MTSYAQFPYAQLQQIAGDLDHLSHELHGEHQGAQDVAGLDERDHAAVIRAVGGLQDEWRSSLLDLIDNVGKTSKISGAIGALIEAADGEMAKNLAGHGH